MGGVVGDDDLLGGDLQRGRTVGVVGTQSADQQAVGVQRGELVGRQLDHAGRGVGGLGDDLDRRRRDVGLGAAPLGPWRGQEGPAEVEGRAGIDDQPARVDRQPGGVQAVLRRLGLEVCVGRGQGEVGIGADDRLALDVEHPGRRVRRAAEAAVASAHGDDTVRQGQAGADRHGPGAGVLDHLHAAGQHGVLRRQQGVPACGDAVPAVEIDAAPRLGRPVEIGVVGRIDRVAGRRRRLGETGHDGVDLTTVGELIAVVAAVGVGIVLAEHVARAARAGDEFIGVDVAAAFEVDRRARGGVDGAAGEGQHGGGRRGQRVGVRRAEIIFRLVGGDAVGDRQAVGRDRGQAAGAQCQRGGGRCEHGVGPAGAEDQRRRAAQGQGADRRAHHAVLDDVGRLDQQVAAGGIGRRRRGAVRCDGDHAGRSGRGDVVAAAGGGVDLGGGQVEGAVGGELAEQAGRESLAGDLQRLHADEADVALGGQVDPGDVAVEQHRACDVEHLGGEGDLARPRGSDGRIAELLEGALQGDIGGLDPQRAGDADGRGQGLHVGQAGRAEERVQGRGQAGQEEGLAEGQVDRGRAGGGQVALDRQHAETGALDLLDGIGVERAAGRIVGGQRHRAGSAGRKGEHAAGRRGGAAVGVDGRAGEHAAGADAQGAGRAPLRDGDELAAGGQLVEGVGGAGQIERRARRGGQRQSRAYGVRVGAGRHIGEVGLEVRDREQLAAGSNQVGDGGADRAAGDHAAGDHLAALGDADGVRIAQADAGEVGDAARRHVQPDAGR